MANFVSQVKLPNNTTYTIRDPNARPLSNNDFDTINVTELNAGDLIVTGGARFLNTINGDISGNSATATSATSATKATQDESGNNIKSTYANAISISDHTITLKNKNGTSLGTVTVPDNNTTYAVATGTANGKIKVTPSNSNAYEVSVYGLKSAAYKDVTDTYSETGTDPVSGKAVKSAIDGLPSPMVFRGTVGTGGTVTNVPTDGTAVVGDTYKVITNGVYGGKSAKVGDTLICLTKTSTANTWEIVPSGDEPSGTVTSVAVANGGGLSVSGSPITSSGTITISHADTSSQASVNNSGRTYIQDITLDTYGHVTGIASATETVVNTDRYVNSAAFADATSADANNPVKMTLTRAGSDTASVTAYIPKVSSSSAGVAPKGAAVSSQSQTTKFLREDGTWAAPSYTTNTNTTYSLSASGESVVLSGSDNSSKSVSLSTLINGLSTGSSTPVDNDYYVSQYVNGGTTTTSYHRRPMYALWAYIQGKTDPRYFMYRGKTTTASDPTLYTSIGTKQYNGVLPDGLTSQYVWGQTISIAGENARFDMYVSHLSSNTGTTYGISYRSGWDNDKKPWQTILDSNNYTAYTVKKDGTGASGTWGISISGNAATATSATTASSIKTEGDNRTVATTPNDYVDKLMFRGLKTQSYIGNPGGTSGYSYLLGLRGWGDSSGGDAHELAFNNNGVYYRHGATTTWGDWVKIFTSVDTYTGTLTSSQVTTALGFTPTANTGTITSVKTTAGTHTTINVTSGAANFNVPTKTSHLTNDSGFVTTDTKNTAGSTDTSSKIFLIGATSQAANPQTYSDNEVYTTSGVLTTKSVQVGGGSATMEYSATTKSINFVFAS